MDDGLRRFLLHVLRHRQVVDVGGAWPAIRHGYRILEWVRARSSEPGEFRRAIAGLREKLKVREGELDGWHHDFYKAEEIYGKEEPVLVVEYAERASSGGEGWLFYLDPARERSFVLGGQDIEADGPPQGAAQTAELLQEEDRLRERVIRFVQEQPDLSLEDVGARWPAIVDRQGVYECQLAEESSPRIVGYQIQMAEHVLRDASGAAAEYRRQGALFSRLREASRPQCATYAPARRLWPKLQFWADRDRDFLFRASDIHAGSVNDHGIVQWSLLPFGTRDPERIRRIRELDDAKRMNAPY